MRNIVFAVVAAFALAACPAPEAPVAADSPTVEIVPEVSPVVDSVVEAPAAETVTEPTAK